MSDKPMAAVILFAGGQGALELKGPSEMKWRGNFVVRLRHRFADHGFMVAGLTISAIGCALGILIFFR